MSSSTTERGIIITPPYEFDGSAFKSSTQNHDPAALRQYLLYWDRMDWPINHTPLPFGMNLFGNESSETQYLQEVGVLTRSQFAFEEGALIDVAKAVPTTQLHCLELLNMDEPGQWSLAQQSALLVDPVNAPGEARSIEVELYNSIPIPAPEVPLENILEFKNQRRDELVAFRSAMDDLYQQVISAGDIPRAKLQAQATIEKSIIDLKNTMKESFQSRLLSSLKIELNGLKIVTASAAGALAASQFSLPPEIGAGLSSVASMISFELIPTRQGMNIPDSLKDYAYLHSVSSELI